MARHAAPFTRTATGEVVYRVLQRTLSILGEAAPQEAPREHDPRVDALHSKLQHAPADLSIRRSSMSRNKTIITGRLVYCRLQLGLHHGMLRLQIRKLIARFIGCIHSLLAPLFQLVLGLHRPLQLFQEPGAPVGHLPTELEV